MNIKQEYIKADIEALKKRKQKLIIRKKEIEVTLQGIELRIVNKELLLK